MANARLFNEQIFKIMKERQERFKLDPSLIYAWWLRPCKVKVLLLADGGLDFGDGDFGLSTFVSILQHDGRNYVRFDITLAHRGNGNLGNGIAGIANRIPNFRFNNAAHFTDTMYDQVWLFGSASKDVYQLTPDELTNVSRFMNKGGGVFATGDHGSLGNALCGNITRVRSMRLWNSTSPNDNLDQVSMRGALRNDTNRPGHDTRTQFDDQSDDIPQTIHPKLYANRISPFWRETYPHPLLCSPLGRINVLPDHAHEGECIVPTNLGLTYMDGTPEYPTGLAPELIATSNVLAGNVAGDGKEPTQAHSFGAISAYDGHRANVGRVVTDATWHHFINVNLIGELNDYINFDAGIDSGEPEDASVNRANAATQAGFMYSAAGQGHLEFIKHYYINIAVWIARPSNHKCFNTRLIWHLLYQHRVMEATMDNPTLVFDKISTSLLYSIGTHATDVLGRKAGQCRRKQFIIDMLSPTLPDLAKRLDPWLPLPPKPVPNPPLPWLDLKPLFSLAVGSGLLAVRDKLPYTDGTVGDKVESQILEVFQEGAKRGLEIGFKTFGAEMKEFLALMK
jgi:hypothetical protein